MADVHAHERQGAEIEDPTASLGVPVDDGEVVQLGIHSISDREDSATVVAREGRRAGPTRADPDDPQVLADGRAAADPPDRQVVTTGGGSDRVLEARAGSVAVAVAHDACRGRDLASEHLPEVHEPEPASPIPLDDRPDALPG